MLASSSNSSEWNNDDKWSSQVRKSGAMSKTSTVKLVSDQLVIDIDMDSDTATESDLSLNHVHSWTEWMTDCEICWTVLQKIQCKTLTNVLWFGECLCLRRWKHLCSWERITQTIYIPSKIHGKISLQRICSRYLNSWYWNNRMRFLECLKSGGKFLHGNSSLVNDEEVISLSHAKVYVFSDSVLCLGKMNQNPTSNTVRERQLEWFKDSSKYWTLDTIVGEPMEFEWNIFPGFSTLELVREVQNFMSSMGKPQQFQGRIIFVSMFNDIISGNEDNETECIANSTLVSLFAKRFPARRWSFLGPGSETKWYSTDKERPGRKWDRVADDDQIRRKRTPSFPSNESVVSKNAQKQKRWEIIYTFLCRWWYDWNCCFAQSFLSIRSVSTEQSQQCDEYSIRAIRPIFRASTLTDNDTHILEWDSCTRNSIAEAQRTSGKTFHNQINW